MWSKINENFNGVFPKRSESECKTKAVFSQISTKYQVRRIEELKKGNYFINTHAVGIWNFKWCDLFIQNFAEEPRSNFRNFVNIRN